MSKNNYLNRVVAYDMSVSSEPSHVYIDLSVINADDGTSGKGPIALRFSDSRDKSVITDPSSYYVSIVRFHIDTVQLPVMIPAIQLGQVNPNLCIYSFTLSYQGHDFQQFIIFEPQDLTTKAPAAPTTVQDVDSGYYYLYSFAYFVGLCNKALQSAFNGLAALVDLPSTHAPFLMYDPTSSELIFNADVLGYDNSLTDYIQIFFNVPCYNLFCSFQTKTLSYSDPVGKNYLLQMVNDQGMNVAEMNTYNAVQVYQEFISSATWSCVQSIVLSSPTLPINGTMQSQTSLNGQSELINYNTNITVPIISDFEVSIENGLDYKPSINYSPNIYRMLDLFGHQDLNNIDINVYWRDNSGNLHPLMIPANSNANIKVMFRKKYLGI